MTNEEVILIAILTNIALIGIWVNNLQRQVTHTRNAVNMLLTEIERVKNDHK